MQLSVDIFNGLLLYMLKAMLVLVVVHRLLERSRGQSAATAHGLSALAIVAVGCMPLLTIYLPPSNIPLIPPAFSYWLSIPVVAQVNGSVSYNSLVLSAVFVYLLVAAWFLSYLLIGILQVVQLTRRSRKAPEPLQRLTTLLARKLELRWVPHVKITDEVASPQVWGWHSPVVLVPADYESWGGSRLRRVLAHELAHIKRNDWLTKVALSGLAGLLWFVPFVRSNLKRSMWYAELACDDCVVTLEGARAEYADDLLALSSAAAAPVGAVSFVTAPDVYLRIRAVLDGSRNRSRVTASEWFRLVFLISCFLLPLASVRAVVSPDDSAVGTGQSQLFTLVLGPQMALSPPSDGTGTTLPGITLKQLSLLRQVPPLPPQMPEEIIVVADKDTPTTSVAGHEVMLTTIPIDTSIAIQRALPSVTVMPNYPPRALQRRIEGSVTVEFDVDVSGAVLNPRVIYAQPNSIFNRSALAAIARFRFQPPRIDDQPITIKSQTETFVFQLAENLATDNQPQPNRQSQHESSVTPAGG